MILKRISILNYKNLEQVELDFSPKMNCIIGQNGMGKTNLLDAVYYLSFCKSATNPIDSQNMMHQQDFFVIQGFYETEQGETEEVYCGMKRRQKKQFKRNKKEYSRLSDHIGFIPLVMVSPSDAELILGGSEERRRFMDVVISQYDKEYLEALIRYNKALQQRNSLLKNDEMPDPELLDVWEEMMAASGEVVYRKRCAFIEEFIPIFQTFYSQISQNKEEVGLVYESHAQQGNLVQLLKENRRSLNRMEVEAMQAENENLRNQLELKRKEVMSVAMNITEQKEVIHQLYEKLKQIRKVEDAAEKDRMLDKLHTDLSLRMNFTSEIDSFYTQVEQLHKDFGVRLTEKFPDLTRQERRLVILLRLDFSTKYIATLMNISPKSVEISRHRLRAKLGLKREQNTLCSGPIPRCKSI